MRRSVLELITGACALLLVAAPPLLGEVGASKSGTAAGGIILDPDSASPSAVWRLVRPAAGSLALNLSGEGNGDVEADIRVNPLTHEPEVVWANWDGHDYEIAWSRFDGSSWSEPMFLTSNEVDDRRPALSFGSAGDLGVAWERLGQPSTIWYRENDPEAGWSGEIPVSDGQRDALEPSIAWEGSTPRVGFHEVPAGDDIRVVVAGGDNPQPWPVGFIIDLVGLTSWAGTLEQDTQAVDGRLYTVWVDSSAQLAYARLVDGAWQPPEFEAYDGEDDIARAKLRVKLRVARAP